MNGWRDDKCLVVQISSFQIGRVASGYFNKYICQRQLLFEAKQVTIRNGDGGGSSSILSLITSVLP